MLRDPLMIHRARQLRRDVTEAEKRLWHRIRRRKLDGQRFRRQVPLGGYIADFACLASCVIIELDGGQHAEDDNEALDAERTAWLEREGYLVLRFWNSQVLTEIDSVTETIYNALVLRRGSDPDRPPP